MKAAAAKTPARLLSGRAMLETENSDVATPKGSARTPRGSIFTRTLTCPRPRPLVINETSTSIKRRPSPMGGDSVKVFVRVKPVMEDDIKQGRAKEALEICERDGKRGIILPAANSKENWFSDFDGVLDDATNHDVFSAIGGDLLRQYLGGVNVSIMAYGQTGSGKTYTMFGCSEPDGQAQGLLHLVLNRIDEKVCTRSHLTRLSVSVFEVYNDELFSLLDDNGVGKKPLAKGMPDYYQHQAKQVHEAADALSLVLSALQHRARDATVRNATSSRSHAFVKLRLEQLPAGPEEQGLDSTLFLVDLAGSESMLNASSSAQQNETIHINKSLQALERVVNSLSNCSAHVPYRDSLLTLVLQEGLNPLKARVALVTTVSRFQGDVAVTKSTLMFAQRARNIRTFAQVNVAAKRPPQSCPEEVHRQLQNMQAINNKLRQQLADLLSSQERQQGRYIHYEAMQEDLLRLSDMHSELQRTSARQQHEAEAALEAERAAHAATRATLAEVQRCNSELQAAASAAEEEARLAGRSVAELRSRLAEVQLQSVRLNGELAGAQSLTAQVQAQHRAAEEQLVAAREQLTLLKGRLAAAEAGGAQHEFTLQQRMTQLQAEMQQQQLEANLNSAGLSQELADSKQLVTQLQCRISDILAEQKAAEEERALRQQQQLLQQQQLMASQPEPQLGLQAETARAESGVQVDLQGEEEEACVLQSESSDGALALVADLENAQAQLEDCTGQLAEAHEQLQVATAQAEAAEEQLAEAREQLQVATEQAGAAEEQLAEVRAAAEAQISGLKQQLAEAAAARSAAVAVAAQEARSAAEAAAATRLVPLQTECERLQAMCSLSEQQLERLQTVCERLREEGSAARQDALRAREECERLREVVQRAEAEAAERQARLEAQAERDVAPKPDALKQLQERVRVLEADKKRVEADHRGQLEFKDKLIRQLENMNFQLQSDVTKLRQDAVAADPLAAAPGPTLSGGGATGGSPFAAAQPPTSLSPGPPLEEGTPMSSSAPPSRAPSGGGGILLLNRTTTGSAAALARNNSRTLTRPDFSTPPPAPRYAPGTGPSQGQGPSPGPAYSGAAQPPNPKVGLLTPPSGSRGHHSDLVGLVTPGAGDSTPGPSEPRLTPTSCPPMDDGLVIVMRGAQQSPDLKLSTNAVRNQMNY